MAKRIVYHITFDRLLSLWNLKKAGTPGILMTSPYKKMLIKDGRLTARNEWVTFQNLSQLVVHGKDGKVNFENTYPRASDPKRYKG